MPDTTPGFFLIILLVAAVAGGGTWRAARRGGSLCSEPMTEYSAVAPVLFAFCVAELAALAALIWAQFKVSYETYHSGLITGAACVVAFGVFTLLRVIALAKEDTPGSRRTVELVSFVLFWALVPPGWFFVEYYAFDSRSVPPPPCIVVEAAAKCDALKEHLGKIKDYADYASKIWVALAGVMSVTAAALLTDVVKGAKGQ